MLSDMKKSLDDRDDDKVANGTTASPKSAVPTQIRHRHIGVWEHFEEIEPTRSWLAKAPLMDKVNELVDCWPYVVRMFKDVLTIPGCPRLVLVYAATELGNALIPALTIWFQGQFLNITQVAIDTRTVDKEQLIRISIGTGACTIASWFLSRVQRGVVHPLNGRIRRWWAVHSFHAQARLDLPTFEQGHVRRQLNQTSDNYRGQAVVWQTLELVTDILSAVMQLLAQLVVLFQVLRGHRDGVMLGLLTLFSETLYWISKTSVMRPVRVWVATTFNKDYLRMQGWKRVVRDTSYRKEFVAGNLAEHATSEFRKASARVGDLDADWDEISEVLEVSGQFWYALYQPMRHIPQIIFTLRAARYPASIPVSLASLNLVQDASSKFAWAVYDIIYRAKSVESQLTAVRKVYEVVKIPNLVPDGTVPFPEDTAQIRHGISLEFKDVSFKYPETEKYALRGISFSVGHGQLCVIVGANGSGKSTILKLATRIYDPEEGQILLNGRDIRTLRLGDLRAAISVLFQDYTIFPLSIRDNIAIGDPETADDDDRIRLAARLAGAEDLIDKLPDGFDSYLERPVDDEYSSVADGTKTLMGRVVNYDSLREAANIKSRKNTSLSGGQMQRLAVARSFMRSIVQNDTAVGLLLFDEPSAALDPAAEHDLFNRLRELRGSKTMVFSSHRFGNLTRHADLILYMDETGIVESGTHDELLKKEGEYGRLWKLQAQAFVEQ
ncbi:HlyB/MsbA family ABC transporter [Daedaleopsis nitida]|nr:HlyB/MsbA family ABC transporter [Daedaleopsis nitida]